MPVLLALLISLGAGSLSASSNGRAFAVELLRYTLLVSNAVVLFVTSLSHMLKPDIMARELGWPPGGPFQTVVGFWNFAVSIICLFGFLGGAEARLSATLATAIFWSGAACLHWSAVVAGEGGQTRLVTAASESALVVTLVVLLVATT